MFTDINKILIASITINWDDVIKSLKIMGFGMVGILIVMLLIYLLIIILNKITSDKIDDKK